MATELKFFSSPDHTAYSKGLQSLLIACVDKLGGELTITEEELLQATRCKLVQTKHPTTGDVSLYVFVERLKP